MLDYTTLYPGVREILDQFQAAGIQMAVLTNKPVRFSQAIVDGLGLTAHFRRVYGGNSFEQKKPHPMGIETLMSEYGAVRAKTVMIGDSSVDIQTARNACGHGVGRDLRIPAGNVRRVSARFSDRHSRKSWRIA